VRCPSCPKRQTADGSQQEAGEDARAPSAIETWDETQLLDRVERFRQERNAGRATYELMSPIEWEAMLIWDETIEQYRRNHEIRVEQMFQMMVAAVTRT